MHSLYDLKCVFPPRGMLYIFGSWDEDLDEGESVLLYSPSCENLKPTLDGDAATHILQIIGACRNRAYTN